MDIPLSIIIQWVIMLLLIVYFYIVGRKIRKIPRKNQNFWEMVIEKANSIVESNIGESYKGLSIYFLVLSIFLFLCNMTGLIGIKNPTADYSVCLALGIMNFMLIQYYAIKKNGVKEYLMGFFKPMSLMFPLNLMERILLPISLSLRLFGNIFAAYLILEIIYEGLISISSVVAFGIPIPFHMFFDIFDGTLQVIIFILLSMINMKIICEH
ncbi:F0F1 ATP synthase subunit A [Oceanirhabdus sp. W0125-5]|uniref:F0F1 ATP synthase subunit A n=1 Tax=Oceanirhabdus sp. W0125-5 TaxID=2999116 RepID=UPI0022F31CBE|nr:F0F1 ATP synthase subunit A [Oceanirhabdus sp. W0125-5]WBW98488.1 F0F1 ATP synthase subunit A [Oceanirhabdus sp. W0125-5]